MPGAAMVLATKWDLSDVLPASKGAEFEKVKAELEASVRRLELLREGLGQLDAEGLRNALDFYSQVSELRDRIGGYALMRFSEDTRNQEAKVLVDISTDLWAEVDNRTLFLKLWWIGLPEERAATLLQADPDYSYFLQTLRKLKPHTLDEKVEQAINLKNATGAWQWVHHYDHLTSAFTYVLSIRGKVQKDKRGKPKRLVTSELVKLVSSPDAETRRAAYDALLTKYGENCGPLGDIYRTIVRDWKSEFVKLRKYTSPIAVRNMENDVSDTAVETLLGVCKKNARVFQDFFVLKAKMIGSKKLSRYHIYAPLQRKERKVSFEDGARQVLEAFESFDGKFASLARNVFEQRHVDAYPRLGKRSGAYCESVAPQITPYLFLNHAGAPRDVYTIAHESGHAVHSQLASSHSMLTFHPTLVLAETASVFGEMILFDKMMKEEKDAGLRRALLVDKISSLYATIGRQSHFVVFEIDAHKAVEEGATVDELCDLYLKNLKGQFGARIEVPKEFAWEWTYIPHIYQSPFYCYAYAFGNLLSLALYERYRKQGKDFVPGYLRLLSYGGSASPDRILQEVGVDMESEEFWESGFDVVRGMVSELRGL